jgi:2-polyprenyl-6-methoxyphenol hydroxylase-like FAD-dependent oxidoreductase
MMYDVAIVGARCAGSPTALLLARKGYRVRLVDQAAFPSDTMSTHHIHRAGVARVKRWGCSIACWRQADHRSVSGRLTSGRSR